MKTRLGLFCLALAMLAWGPTARGQYDQSYPAGAVGQQGGFQPARADFQLGLPGRVWFESNFADRGLGYQGSYLTLGGKTQLFEDFLDGRWISEGQGHYAIESGGFFGNFGLSRVFSVQSAGADFTLGAWVDYDGDKQGDFAHDFTQVSVNGSIKTRRWDVIGNGYFPIATTDYALGDPTGVNCFIDNRIVMIPGIDSALEGFDVTLRTRPQTLSMVNGTLDVGGYAYQSELIDQFGGARVRLGFQLLQGMIINAEVNHDDRFSTTGVLQLAFAYGANARGNEYSMVGRDLEPTIRNDHIVRFQQDVVFAIDPDTGRPYNVIHVDNNADPAFGNGTVETPFDRMVNAQNASVEDDIIFVREGDGTTRNYNTGIVLKDGQMLLGDGVSHLIPVQDGRFFELCNDIDGVRPRITGRNNGPAVTLANRNTVRGLVIDGAAAPGGMNYGIYGDGFAAGSPIDSGIIEDNDISGAILDGIYLRDITGDWNFARNTVRNNGFHGMYIENANDPTSVFNFDSNVVTANGQDGIQMLNYDASEITFESNTTNGNGRDGVRMVNFVNGSGAGLDLDFLGHTASNNVANGVHIFGGTGDLRFLNSTIQNNGGDGLRIVDWTNPTASDLTLIDATLGGASIFEGNNIGINVRQSVGDQTLLVRNTTIDGNLVAGLRALADSPAVVLNSLIINNESISNNLGDGLQFIVNGGATHNVRVNNSTALFGNLPMINNQRHGINLLVGDNSGLISRMAVEIEDVNIINSGFAVGSGVNASVFNFGNLDLFVQNTNINGSSGDAFTFDIDNADTGVLNTIVMNNVSAIDNGGSGINLTSGTGTLTDLFVLGSQFTNVANVVTPTNGTPLPQGGTTGIIITSIGDAGDVAIDNRTRLIMRDTLVSNFNVDGINAASFGDSSLLIDLSGNEIRGNGSFFNPDTLIFRHGVVLTSTDSSLMTVRMENNFITDNWERGVVLQTLGTSTMNASLIGNNIADNDRGEDVPNDPIVDSNISDATFINGVTSQMCLTMSNNLFAFPPEFVNLAFPADFQIELDGATNGFVPGDLGPGFTFPAFGTVCEPAIQAEEAAFNLAGFLDR